MKLKAFLVAAVSAACGLASAATVKIVGEEGSWRLERNGKPYFVRGAGGVADYAAFAAAGGNSVRTWGADRAAETLAAAGRHGVTVTVGFWLPHQSEGANYSDPKWCEGLTAGVLETVRAVKGHPGLLMWALGNEMELGIADEEVLWKYIDWLARQVKSVDPDHPVGTVVAEVWPAKVEKIMRLAPSLDWLGINSYGGVHTVGERWRAMGGRKPYVITEFGPPGPTELGLNAFGCPNEWTSTRKADWYEQAYRANMLADKDRYCLGSYAFIWTYKVEGTPTWFGMHTHDGETLAAAERLQELWDRVPLANRVPTVEPMEVSSERVEKLGDTLDASVRATDPDGDRLVYVWTVMPELAFLGETHGVALPKRFDAFIASGQGTPSVVVKPTAGGRFRLYCTVRDGKGGAALASRALLVKGPPPKTLAAPQALPCAVFADGATPRWWATGYMGDAGNLRVDLHCAESPAAGTTCLRVAYAGADWAGLLWQDPVNDWNSAPGGYNLTGAKRLVFKARGAKGGERVNFQCGLGGGAYPDSGGAKLENVTLTREWKSYSIDLSGARLDCVKTGFGFSFGGQGALSFDLDDIQYE